MNRLQIIATGVILYLGIQACTKDTTTTSYSCTGITPTYTTDIKPIYDSYRASSGCHGSNGAAGIKLNTYSNCMSANDSRILGSIEHTSGYNAMPQGSGKLSDTQIQKIYCWIQNGKPQ